MAPKAGLVVVFCFVSEKIVFGINYEQILPPRIEVVFCFSGEYLILGRIPLLGSFNRSYCFLIVLGESVW